MRRKKRRVLKRLYYDVPNEFERQETVDPVLSWLAVTKEGARGG